MSTRSIGLRPDMTVFHRTGAWLGRRTLVAALLTAAAADAARAPPRSAYLLVHFTHEAAEGEQIRFAVSEDGYRWTDLNGSQPVMRSDVGEKGVRDPSIIRLPGRFVILATDLRIESGKGWDAAMHRGSTSLVVFESTDLVHWSKPRLVDVAGTIPGAGCAWAPEAILDDKTGDYFVYWTTISDADGLNKPRIYYSRTRDFRQFTPPRLYIDRPGKVGLIDTQIVKVDEPGSPYRYYRASGDGQITFEGSNELLGPWTVLGDLRAVGLTGKDVEGPILFKIQQTGEWALWVDQYASAGGYLALATRDLSRPATFKKMAAGSLAPGRSKKRHGSILNISVEELQRLQAAWPGNP
jgi:hypothetical protein